MSMTIAPPLDDLFRGLTQVPETRADADDVAAGSLMFGHFAVFDRWTKIDSWFEGTFMERLAPGSFKKTMREQRDSIKVQFDHGYDSHVGDSPLGPIDDLREDATGAYYEVPLLDTDYNRDRILPMLQGRLIGGEQRGSLLGASFRFRVMKEEWVEEPGKSDGNPDGLPERTIREVRLYEFGPVVFPAYEGATAMARSLTDHFLARRVARQGASERAARSLAPPPPAQATAPPAVPEPAPQPLDVPTGRSVAVCRTDIERLRSHHR